PRRRDPLLGRGCRKRVRAFRRRRARRQPRPDHPGAVPACALGGLRQGDRERPDQVRRSRADDPVDAQGWRQAVRRAEFPAGERRARRRARRTRNRAGLHGSTSGCATGTGRPMSWPVPGFPAPGASTEAPLEMLSACHARIERQCATLRRLVPHLAAHGADDEARTAAANVLRYFDSAAKHHHDDEEKDLFPALIESMAGSDAVCLRDLTDALSADHRALDAAWQRVRASLASIAAGSSASLPGDDVEALVNRYQQHIEREEKELLPMAARLPADDELARIGKAMRERRGIGEG